MRRSRRIVISTVIVLLSLAFSLCVVEALVRALHLAPSLLDRSNVPDRYLPHRPRPFSTYSGVSASGEFDYVNRHNSVGFRDVEHTRQKPAGAVRILGLGDSFTYGIGAKFEETYLARLETLLNGRPGTHPRTEIIKAGIPRYFPESERILLEHYGKDYSPDLILIGFVPNDVVDTHVGLSAVVVDP